MNKHRRSSNGRDSESVDTVIVGGGIAGLSAALFIARAGRSTIVYDAGRSRILAVERVHEFIGFDSLSPGEMLTKARQEVLRNGQKSATRRFARSNRKRMHCLPSLFRMK
jgi:thioredoxin reductase